MLKEVQIQWLEIQCKLLHGAHAAAIITESGSAQVYPEDTSTLPVLTAAGKLALRHNKPMIHASEDVNNTDITIACPFVLEDKQNAVVIVALENSTTEKAKFAIGQLQQGLPWVNFLPQNTAQRESSQTKLAQIMHLIASVLSPEKFHEAITALTSELAKELNCERVFLGIRRTKNTRLESISNTSDISHHTALTQAVTASMDEASDQKISITIPPVSNLTVHSSSIQTKLLVKQHNLKAVCLIPLIIEEKVIGSILLERSGEKTFSIEDLVLFEQIAVFLAPIIKLKYRTGLPLAGRMREKASRWKRSLVSTQNASWKLAGAAIFAAIVFLSILPIAYEVTTTSRLEASIQRTIPAPENGYLKSVLVRPGDQVKANQVLIELDDRDLKLQEEKALNEISKLKSSFGNLLASGDRSKLAVIQAEIAEAKANLAFVQQQLNRTKLVSPFDGIILQGDLTQSLGAPLEQGENLLVLSPSNDFRIILEAEQQDIEEISLGQSGRIAFSANPGENYSITVNRIRPVAKTMDGKNVFEIEAKFDGEYSAQLRPGFEGLAKLYVEDRPLIKSGYRRAYNWIKFRIWRWTGAV